MIIFGSGSTNVNESQAPYLECESCGTKGSTYFQIISRHAHIFWIPIFPIGKKGYSQCQHCKRTMELMEMPDKTRQEYLNLQSESKAKIWQFAGIGIIGFFALQIAIGVFFMENKGTNTSSSSGSESAWSKLTKSKSDLRKEFGTPEVGNRYLVSYSGGDYMLSKLVDIRNDSLFFIYNNIVFNDLNQIPIIDVESNFTMDPIGLPYSTINAMHEKNILSTVEK